MPPASSSARCAPRSRDVLADGFIRVRNDDCGHDRLVAFACKGRGFGPSCGSRGMADTAAFRTGSRRHLASPSRRCERRSRTPRLRRPGDPPRVQGATPKLVEPRTDHESVRTSGPPLSHPATTLGTRAESDGPRFIGNRPFRIVFARGIPVGRSSGDRTDVDRVWLFRG